MDLQDALDELKHVHDKLMTEMPEGIEVVDDIIVGIADTLAGFGIEQRHGENWVPLPYSPNDYPTSPSQDRRDGMDKCYKCGLYSVAERSSYTICHSCGHVTKTEWRKKLESSLASQLPGAKFVAAKIVNKETNEVVVQWKRSDTMAGTHVYFMNSGAFFWGEYFHGEDANERASHSYIARTSRSKVRS